MMEIFRGCQAACGPCTNAADEVLDGLMKPRLCSWAEEEEVPTLDGQSPAVGLDYGFLGGLAFGRLTGRSQRSASLCELGGLVPTHGMGKDSAGVPKITDYYVLDAVPMGHGSYGEVTGATHRRTGARRAVKSVGKAGLRRYVKDVSGFVRREVDILRRLDHPNVVRLYEAFEDEKTIYMVLEICSGGDLLERVTVARHRLPEHEAASLMAQMLGAVQHLFLRGVVHRDLKPENFLFTQREPEREPLAPAASPLKLIDFGLSRRLSLEQGTSLTPKIGTTEYMAPEVFAGRVREVLADRTDIWSMGVILHVMFIGHFPSPRLAELTTEEYLSLACWKNISPGGRDFLGCMLRQDPNQRSPVAMALRHPWLAQSASQEVMQVARNISPELSTFADSGDLRRLALVAAAREVDDSQAHHLRRLYQQLEFACEGSLTETHLRRVAHTIMGPVGRLASELSRNFEKIDVDGSGTLDWTEFVAIARGAASREAAVHVAGRTHLIPPLDDDGVWRAFDLLSQGSGAVTVQSLSQLFKLPGSDPGEEPRGDTGGSFDSTSDTTQSRLPLSSLQRLVAEADASGSVKSSEFFWLLYNKEADNDAGSEDS